MACKRSAVRDRLSPYLENKFIFKGRNSIFDRVSIFLLIAPPFFTSKHIFIANNLTFQLYNVTLVPNIKKEQFLPDFQQQDIFCAILTLKKLKSILTFISA